MPVEIFIVITVSEKNTERFKDMLHVLLKKICVVSIGQTKKVTVAIQYDFILYMYLSHSEELKCAVTTVIFC